MIVTNTIEEIIRNADNVCYAMNITVNAYESPVPLKTYKIQDTDEGSTTVDMEGPDWDNGVLLGSKTMQLLIPVNKQTDVISNKSSERAGPSAYDLLLPEWQYLYRNDSNYQKIIQDLIDPYGIVAKLQADISE